MIDHIIVSILAYLLYKYLTKYNFNNEQAIIFVIVINIAYHLLLMDKIRLMYREKFETASGSTIPMVKQEQMAALEKELVRLRSESQIEAIAAMSDNKVQTSVLMNNSQPFIQPPVSVPKSDSCDCDAKVERIINEYVKKKGDDQPYNQLTPQQMEPLGSYDKTFTNKWDHGFTYLDTSKWAPPQRNTPVCKTEMRCPVCPVSTAGYPVSVLEYDESRKVLPPDNININYIKEQLNN